MDQHLHDRLTAAAIRGLSSPRSDSYWIGRGYGRPMAVLLLVLSMFAAGLAAVSAFTTQVNVNELGWLAIAVVLLAASFLPWATWQARRP